MRNRSSNRPSAGAVIGVIALVFALAGTAIAAPGGAQKLTKAKAKKISRQQVKKLAPTLNVASSDGPFARALVRAEPLEVQLGRNIAQAQVDNPRVGTFCFDIGFVPTGAQVTNDLEGGNDHVVVSAVLDPLSRKPRGNSFNACEPGTDVQVTTYDPATTTLVNSSFFIEIWR